MNQLEKVWFNFQKLYCICVYQLSKANYNLHSKSTMMTVTMFMN